MQQNNGFVGSLYNPIACDSDGYDNFIRYFFNSFLIIYNKLIYSYNYILEYNTIITRITSIVNTLLFINKNIIY